MYCNDERMIKWESRKVSASTQTLSSTPANRVLAWCGSIQDVVMSGPVQYMNPWRCAFGKVVVIHLAPSPLSMYCTLTFTPSAEARAVMCRCSLSLYIGSTSCGTAFRKWLMPVLQDIACSDVNVRTTILITSLGHTKLDLCFTSRTGGSDSEWPNYIYL